MTRTRLFLFILVYANAAAPLRPRQGASTLAGTFAGHGALQEQVAALRPQPRGDARPISGYRPPRRCRNRLRDTPGLEKGLLAQRLSLSGYRPPTPLPARLGCVKSEDLDLDGG